jgi:hypothetical protein
MQVAWRQTSAAGADNLEDISRLKMGSVNDPYPLAQIG